MNLIPTPPRAVPPRHFVGVDVGGNRIRAGFYDANLKELECAKRSTKVDRGPDAVIARIIRCIHDAIDEADATPLDVRAIGVGVPGTVDAASGMVLSAPRLGWKEVPLANRLREAFGRPVFVEHDGQLATLAVHAAELKERPRRLLGIFVGHGIGGGWVVDGRPCPAFQEAAGEFGHMVLETRSLEPKTSVCRCGNPGCFENLASRRAVLERIQACVREGRRTVLARDLESLHALRGRDLRRAYRRGDPVALECIEAAARWMGVALANLVGTLEPEAVVLGGSLMEHLGDELLPTIRAVALERAPGFDWVGTRIVTSALGDSTGTLGAAWLARDRTAASQIPPTPSDDSVTGFSAT